MRRSAVYVVLLLLAVIAAAVISIRIFSRDIGRPQETQPPAQATAAQGEDAAAAPAPDTQPEPTLLPLPTEQPENAETPAPTKTPQTAETPQTAKKPETTETPMETRPPMETAAPEPTPPPVSASGSFRSSTGVALNLLGTWTAVSRDENTVTLTVTLSAESYSFHTAALPRSLQLFVNGESCTLDSPAVSYDGETVACTALNTFTAEVPRGITTLEAHWYYNGSYSGVQFSDISAGATVDLS